MVSRKGQIPEPIGGTRPEKAVQLILTGAVLVGIGYLITAFVTPLFPGILPMFSFFIIAGVIIFLNLEGSSRAHFRNWISHSVGVENREERDILQDQLSAFERHIKRTGKEISQMRREMKKVSRQIQQNKRTLEKSKQQAANAKSQSRRKEFIIQSRKAHRLEQSNQKLEDLFRKMDQVSDVLSKLYRYASVQLEDFRSQVELQLSEHDMVSSAHKAMNQAKKVAGQQNEINEKLQAISSEINMTIHHLEHTMQEAQDFFESSDLKEGEFQEPVLQLLESPEWEVITNKLSESKQDQALDLEDPEQKISGKVENKNRYNDYLNDF